MIRSEASGIRSGIRGLVGVLVMAAVGSAAETAPSQRSFASAKDAADALVAALGADDPAQLDALFGPAYARFEPTDEIAAAADRKQLAGAAKQALSLREDSPDHVTLVIGAQAWPFPIPIVEQGGSWRFDTPAGIEELLNRIIGRHELAAIDVARHYVSAQAEYASKDRDGDQVLEYAQNLRSTPGQRDGLYWEATDGERSPFGAFVAQAGEYAKGRRAGDPFQGYYFKLLKGQGSHPPGGAYSYLINGNMIGGYALLAWPADYGESGIMTFVVNQQGTVFQKDLGPKTAAIAQAMTRYDPDASWAAVPD
jgi:hypothetical protein